jgi:predicted TPR repeat methyltransferase
MSQTGSTEDTFNQLFIKACEDQQNGFLDAAISGYKELLESFPQAPILHYNLGLVYYEQGTFQSGCDAFRMALSLSPEDNDILFNLALSLKKNGDVEGAISSFCEVLGTEPESVDTLYNLAGCYRETHRYPDAVETYLQVLTLAPEHRSATNNLAYTYHLLGEDDKSAMYYSKVLDYDPDHKAAQHMLSALSGSGAESVPESYIEDVFDSYSQKYEQSLVVDLQYNVPGQLRTRFNALKWSERIGHGLDLGCGTGLSGEVFTDIVERLDGIDLSENMLQLAGEKNIYHTLHNDNIMRFLKKTDDVFDFYIAADVFGYVGDLGEVFSLLRKQASPRTLFCFSTEKLEGDGFLLRPTGRFAHSTAYIERLAAANGWLLLDRCDQSIRKERESWVEGCLWFLTASE